MAEILNNEEIHESQFPFIEIIQKLNGKFTLTLNDKQEIIGFSGTLVLPNLDATNININESSDNIRRIIGFNSVGETLFDDIYEINQYKSSLFKKSLSSYDKLMLYDTNLGLFKMYYKSCSNCNTKNIIATKFGYNNIYGECLFVFKKWNILVKHILES